VRTVKNNYDLIINFEVNDGTPLSEEDAQNIIFHANYMAKTLAHFINITPWKIIISQAVESKRISQFIEKGEKNE